MPRYRFILLLLLLCLTGLTGCGKEEPPAALETTPAALQDMAPQERKTTFDYGPNPWAGVYITADSSTKADSEVLDSITMNLPEGFTRHRVSDRQIDFVKNGAQAGGVLLVDIPGVMLRQAAQSKDALLELADHLARQVMPDVYPSRAFVSGGGEVPDTDYYLAAFIKTNTENGIWTQYMHRIYLGEQHCYDFWIDEGLWNETGVTVENSLSCEDIKPELNDVEFAWHY